jgi:hypothetical protein
MTIYTGKDAANRTILSLKEGVGGVNRDIKEIWTGKDAVNRKVFQSEISFTDDCNSMAGWNAANIAGLGNYGSAASNGSAIYASAYGSLASAWHGPCLIKNLPKEITDFDLTFTFSLSTQGQNRLGGLYMGLTDNALSGLLYFINLKDSWETYRLDRGFYAPGTSYATTVASGNINWVNFNVRIWKNGTSLKCYDGPTLVTDLLLSQPDTKVSKVFLLFQQYDSYPAFDNLSVGNISLTGK